MRTAAGLNKAQQIGIHDPWLCMSTCLGSATCMSNPSELSDEYYMRRALEAAEEAKKLGHSVCKQLFPEVELPWTSTNLIDGCTDVLYIELSCIL